MLTGNESAPQVVRRRAPALRIAWVVAAVLICVFAAYVDYELGRYDAGYDRQAVAQRRTELEVQIGHLERDNRELRTRLAELDTIRLGRSREQAELARAMGDLQAQVARQSQELAFYRGVVAQGAIALGVRIEQLHISAGTRPGDFIVRLSLVRSGRADSVVSGAVRLSVDGAAAGGASSLDLPALTAGRVRELRYSFRYLQAFQQEVTMPRGFRPEQLEVEVQSGRRGVPPLSQTFLWTVEAAP